MAASDSAEMGGAAMSDTAAGPGGSVRAARKATIRRVLVAPTMRDIAEATGVSQSTVSRVLSGTPTAVPIAEATRRRVTETADRLGYRPNPLARGLRGAPTMLVGVIVRDITDPFFGGAIEAASLEAARHGYNVVLGHAHQSADEAVALWNILEARHCDAILFLGDLRDRPDLIEDLQSTRIPVVALWHGARGGAIPTVGVDNQAGIAQVMAHLVGLGHRRIAFAGPKRLGDITEREAAYSTALVGHRLEARPEYVRDVGNSFDGGAIALDELMDLPQPPSAIVAPTDVLAIGMLHAAHRRGLRVPDDVSVSGFDDIPVAAASVPALTTVRMPTEAMIARAIDLVIGPRDASSDLHPVLVPDLVVRASTGPVPAHAPQGA
jgi:DNA-binding LacI/PurR family transcriptional regulator